MECAITTNMSYTKTKRDTQSILHPWPFFGERKNFIIIVTKLYYIFCA